MLSFRLNNIKKKWAWQKEIYYRGITGFCERRTSYISHFVRELHKELDEVHDTQMQQFSQVNLSYSKRRLRDLQEKYTVSQRALQGLKWAGDEDVSLLEQELLGTIGLFEEKIDTKNSNFAGFCDVLQ